MSDDLHEVVKWHDVDLVISFVATEKKCWIHSPGRHNSYAIPKKILAANNVDLFIAILTVFLKF